MECAPWPHHRQVTPGMAGDLVKGCAHVPIDLVPQHELWMAALGLMMADARAYLAKPDTASTTCRAAWEDLRDCGPMTRHLARFLVMDPQAVPADGRAVGKFGAG